MGFVGNKEVKLGVLLDLDAEFIQALDGCIAGKEVLRTRPEGDDLQISDTDHCACNRKELLHFNSGFFCCEHRIGGNIALQMPHAEIVRAVEHTAVSIASAIDQVSVTFSCRNKHYRTVKLFRNKRFRRLRSEIAEEHDEGIAACSFHIGDSVKHVLFIFNSDFALINALAISLYNRFSAGDRKSNGETVTGYGNNTKFYFRNILHSVFSSHF